MLISALSFYAPKTDFTRGQSCNPHPQLSDQLDCGTSIGIHPRYYILTVMSFIRVDKAVAEKPANTTNSIASDTGAGQESMDNSGIHRKVNTYPISLFKTLGSFKTLGQIWHIPLV